MGTWPTSSPSSCRSCTWTTPAKNGASTSSWACAPPTRAPSTRTSSRSGTTPSSSACPAAPARTRPRRGRGRGQPDLAARGQRRRRGDRRLPAGGGQLRGDHRTSARGLVLPGREGPGAQRHGSPARGAGRLESSPATPRSRRTDTEDGDDGGGEQAGRAYSDGNVVAVRE